MSRYLAARQDDGRGWLVLRLDEIGGSSGTVVDCNLPEDAAHDLLAELRASEVLDPEYPIEIVDADIRAAAVTIALGVAPFVALCLVAGLPVAAAVYLALAAVAGVVFVCSEWRPW